MTIDQMEGLLERAICTTLVMKIIYAGFRISLHAGEEELIHSSTDVFEITGQMFKAEIERICVRTQLGKFIGDIYLVYGNGENVITHWTDTHEINEIVDACTPKEKGSDDEDC